MAIRWIDAGRVSHYRSQSIYHGLGYAQTPETPDTVVMVIPENPYICVGYFQDAAKEVDLDYCRDNGLPVIRRETGGGTVYIDSGQLFVQWVCQPGFLPRKVEQRFQLFNKAIIETYTFFGIQAYHYPVNDVHVEGRKIVGTGAATIGNAEVITGNFLFDFDIEIMTRALNLPGPEFRQVINSSLNNYMTWMNRELNHPPTYTEVIDIYKTKCELALGTTFIEGEFTPDELRAIEQAEEKLADDGWLHSVKSPGSKNKLIKIHAGVWVGWMIYESAEFSVHVFSQIRNNVLEMVRFYLPSVSIPPWNMDKLAKELTSVPLAEEELEKRISEFFKREQLSDHLNHVDHWTRAVMQIKSEIQKVSGHA